MSDNFLHINVSKNYRIRINQIRKDLRSRGISVSESCCEGLMMWYNELLKAEGNFTPFDGYYQKKKEEYEANNRIPKQRILNDIAVEVARSNKDPEAEKNVLILADALSDEDLESLSDHAQTKIFILRRKAARIANKVTPNSLPTGEK